MAFTLSMTTAVETRAEVPLAYPGELKVGYLTSYQFDLCGDRAAGQVMRRLLRRFGEECHFSRQANQLFSDVDSEMQQNWHGEIFPPEHKLDSGMTCEAFLQLEVAAHLKAVEDRVWNGKMSAADALRMDCDGHSTAR